MSNFQSALAYLTDSRILTANRSLADYFEQVVKKVGRDNAKLAANWIMGDLLGALNKDEKPLSKARLWQFAKLLGAYQKLIRYRNEAKQAFIALFAGEGGDDETSRR